MPEEYKARLKSLGSPYAGAEYSFPPLRKGKENGYDATSHVLRCGTDMNEFNKRQGVPKLLRDGLIGLILRYGLDGKIYSSWGITCPQMLKEIATVQKGIVGMRVIGLKIGPPQYLTPWLEEDQIERVITQEHIEAIPALRGADIKVVCAFVRYEQAMIADYCRKKNRQRRVWKLDGTLSTDEMGDQAAQLIAKDIRRRFAA